MSTAYRDKPQYVTVCDLCDGEIDNGNRHDEWGSLLRGASGPPVTERTKTFQLFWPSGSRQRSRAGKPIHGRGNKRGAYFDPQYTERQYDFHAECILRLVEHSVALREDSRRTTQEGNTP